MRDLYAILEVSSDASEAEIKRAYRRRAREAHPDAGGDEEEFKAVTHAYEVLSDPAKRDRYDRFGDDGTPRTRSARGGDAFGGFGGGLDDVIDAFFGNAFGQRGAGGRRQQRREAGRDVLVPLDVTVEDILTGGEFDVEVEVARGCEECGGTGSASRGGPERCRECGGAGQVQQVVRTAFGQLATASSCPACDGTGRSVRDPCRVCGGDGREVRARTVTVEMPPGVDDGDRLKVAGEGEAGRQGAPTGDLYVEVRVADHDVYERDGRDLHRRVTVPFTQAALGAKVVLTGLGGDELEAEIPAGTQPGEVVSVRGAGLYRRGGAGARGRLHLHVQVETPADLDGEQRELIRQLAELRGEETTERSSGLFARLREALP